MLGLNRQEIENELSTLFTGQQREVIVSLIEKNNERIEKELQTGVGSVMQRHVNESHR